MVGYVICNKSRLKSKPNLIKKGGNDNSIEKTTFKKSTTKKKLKVPKLTKNQRKRLKNRERVTLGANVRPDHTINSIKGVIYIPMGGQNKGK